MKSHKFWLTAALSLGALALAITTKAQVNTNLCPNLSINWAFDVWGFQNANGGSDGHPVVNNPAGLALSTNWNDNWNESWGGVAWNGNTGGKPNFLWINNLWDSSLANSGMSIAHWEWNGVAVFNNGNSRPPQDADGSFNLQMINGYMNIGPTWPVDWHSWMIISNVPYATYDVVVYFNSDVAGRNASIDNGRKTNYISTVGVPVVAGANALFLPAESTNSSSFPQADFAFFPMMTNSVATFLETPLSGSDQWLGFADIQVIQASNTYVLYGAYPVTQIVPVGQPATFKVIAGGLNPSYQWQHDGTNVPNATNAIYSIGSTALGQDGSYDVVVTNSFSSVTSSVANLTFYTPRTDTWAGVGSTWDTSSLNWTQNGGLSDTNYTETDNVRFDPLGVGNSTVSLSGTFTPTSITVSNAIYMFTSGALGGSGSLHLTSNATLILDTADGRGTLSQTVIDSGSTLQVGNNDTAAVLGAGALTNNGTLIFDAAGAIPYAHPIYGTGDITNECSAGLVTLGVAVDANYLVQTGAGSLLLQGNNMFTGGLVVSGGTVEARGPNVLGNAPVVVAGGELQLIYGYDFVVPSTTLSGGLLHSGLSGSATLEGPVILTTSSEIDVDSGQSLTLNGAINGGGFGLTVGGTGGTLVLNQAYNSLNNLTINNGTVAFNSAANLLVTNPITGAGNLSQTGSGTIIFTGDLSGLSGETTVSAGTLAGNTTNGGSVSVLPGATLAPGTPSAIGTMTVNGSLTLGGNLAVKLNKSLVQSNDMVVVSSASNTNNGLVTVNNLGPALAVGDTFTLFSSPVSGGDMMSVLGGGVIWSNNLVNDGSISVLAAAVPPVITSTMASASTLVFSGNNGYPGSPYAVLATTNLMSPWTVIATGNFSGTGTFSVTNSITPDVPQTFYRLEQ
jgi:autotransporter-associated beta strand protein